MRFFSAPSSSTVTDGLFALTGSVFKLVTRPYVVKRRPAKNAVDQEGDLIRRRLNNRSIIVSRIAGWGNMREEIKDLMARKSYIDKVKSPGQDFSADDIAFAFC